MTDTSKKPIQKDKIKRSKYTWNPKMMNLFRFCQQLKWLLQILIITSFGCSEQYINNIIGVSTAECILDSFLYAVN